jgi:hypothetical protein
MVLDDLFTEIDVISDMAIFRFWDYIDRDV